MWNDIWMEYVKDWNSHSMTEHVMQVLSIVVILFLGVLAIRFLGKKSISQLTLTDVLFIFVLSSTLGALITKPVRILIGLLCVVVIVSFVWILQKLQLKLKWVEKVFVPLPDIIFYNGMWFENNMKRNNITVAIVESIIRQRGYSSIEICKRIIIEPTGAVSIELKPEWEPVKSFYFDDAMNQILRAIDEKNQYKKPIPPEMNLVFEEIEQGKVPQKK
jgi:uncharacterized membrane protein YcaP (DUF421 family)